jgi:hypothetical protein
MEDDVARSQNVYYPELTMGSVWTYVYGWGLLLFVCVYCLAAIDVPASCWWAMGMIALSFDELISKGLKNYWVVVLELFLAMSVFSLWSGSLVDKDGDIIADSMFNSSSPVLILNFLMGVVYPVAVPFIFFTIRSTARTAMQDVRKLCEFAMPFMVVLALCSLVATSGVCSSTPPARDSDVTDIADITKSINALSGKGGSRRLLGNETVMIETVAKFASSYANNLEGKNGSLMRMLKHDHTLPYLFLFLSPFAVLWLIRVLIVSVLTGHTTEFITSFLLVVSSRHGAVNNFGVWSLVAAGASGTVFILLLLVRRG